MSELAVFETQESSLSAGLRIREMALNMTLNF